MIVSLLSQKISQLTREEQRVEPTISVLHDKGLMTKLLAVFTNRHKATLGKLLESELCSYSRVNFHRKYVRMYIAYFDSKEMHTLAFARSLSFCNINKCNA